MNRDNTVMLKPNCVVVAANDAETRGWMAQALEQEGFGVIEVEDGEGAVAAFQINKPSILLLARHMPRKDGVEVCAEIRKLKGGRHVPIVMVTSREDLESVHEAFDAGASDFIATPVTSQILAHRVRYILRASTDYRQLRTSEAKNDAFLQAIPDAMLVISQSGRILTFVPGSNTRGLPDPSPTDVTVFDYLPERVAAMFYKTKQTVADDGKPLQQEFRLEDENGRTEYFDARFVPYLRDQTLVVISEITERKLAEERNYRLAFFDPLTDLPNRQFFMQHLQKMIEQAEGTKAELAVIYVDLDNFKRINDNLGHSYGDGVLKVIAGRLSQCIRSNNTGGHSGDEPVGVARLGGDEFVTAIEGLTDEAVLRKVTERVRDKLREPVRFRGHEFVVTPSIGVATYPRDGDNVEDLLKFADVAMYQAKGAGRDSVRFYSSTMNLRSRHRLELEAALRKAIASDDLDLHFQPKRDLHTGYVVGVEALVRWQREDGEFIPPSDFVPIAEESGLIAPLGEWVLKAACSQARDWQRRLGASINMAVNISSQQFYHSNIRETVMKALFESSLRPGLLQLELTESILMRDVQETIDTLDQLRQAGVTLAIDDFGTGYSSLSYLKRFPLDALKIDRSFVMELEDNNDDAAICSAIIAMAHSLGLKVIAEGIETDIQLEFLRGQGCDEGQGFLLGKPLAADAFERAIAARPHILLKDTAS